MESSLIQSDVLDYLMSLITGHTCDILALKSERLEFEPALPSSNELLGETFQPLYRRQ